MPFMSDFLAIIKVVFKKTNKTYISNMLLGPMLGVYVIGYTLVSLALMLTVGRLGNAGFFLFSIMSWFISCFFISDYLVHLDGALVGRKFRLKAIGSGYMHYFRPLLTATAVPRIVVSLFGALTGIAIPTIYIILFYLVYAIPEIVYQKNMERLEMFTYGHKYLLENWKPWLIINATFGFLMVGALQVINAFIVSPIMDYLAGLSILSSWSDSMLFVIELGLSWMFISIVFIYYFIFRGYIFKILSVSSRRKREYMRNIYGKQGE